MEFPESYFEDEVREGFYVPGLMKRSWAAQMQVLEDVKTVCKKHNIPYFAEWGTLLGAIRHGGMIPWDDDMDICMKRKDYEKFLEVAEQELPDGYWLSNYRTFDTENLVTRIQNSKYPVLSAEQMERFHGFPYIMGIDLFVLDFLPGDSETEEQLHELIYFLCTLYTQICRGEIAAVDLERCLCDVERICYVSIDRKKPLAKQLLRIVEDIFAEFTEEEAEYLTNNSIWLENKDYRIPKCCYESSLSMPYGNTEIAVPLYYEQLLKQKYGDYMKPVHAGGSHDYPGYESQIDAVYDETGVEPLQYKFNSEDLREEGRLSKVTLREKVMEFILLFSEAHRELCRMAEDGEQENLLNLLGDCQESAIQLGTMIEGELDEPEKTVAVLEQYCETVFQIYEGTIKNIADGVGRLDDYIQQLKESMETIPERRQIVFVPYKASLWGTMESVWKNAVEEENTDVYVIPAPYYYKDVYGQVKKEKHYDLDGYPEYVTLTSYEDYNFEVHHPDVIVIQCPYDEYNYGMTLHPFFYARNLKKYTEQLVYIPALSMDEIGPEDVRAKKMLKYYCNMPGVVLADMVILQSEQMKQVYVELLTEFAGEDTKVIWENKIKGIGLPIYEYEKLHRKKNVQIPESWLALVQKPDGNPKKVILYSTSVSALLSDKEQMIDKMKKVFLTFRENQDEVALLWCPDSKAGEMLCEKHPELWQKYRDLVQEYKEKGWGIYDDTGDYHPAVEFCDACYGDGGVILNECRVHGKPVMVQNSNI